MARSCRSRTRASSPAGCRRRSLPLSITRVWPACFYRHAHGDGTPARAPISITKLTAIGWYGRPLGCHYGWYNPRRIQAGLGGLSPDEYEETYHRAERDHHR